MTRRQDLEHQRHSLGEIREIMNSMKTLAYMETRKLARFHNAQHAVVMSIEEMAADFLSFYPETLPEADAAPRVYILTGTERGFCSDFNQVLLRHLESALYTQHPVANPALIIVGRKLHTLLENDSRVVARLDGASVVEEVPVVLNEVVNALSSLQEKHGMLTVFGLFHSGNDGIAMQKLLPPFQHHLHQPSRFAHPPLMNLSPAAFLFELTEHYLFAALHEMLYTSLMAENLKRVSHLEGAVKHLDDKSAELVRKSNALRQEEIIEEIEVILLSASSLDED